MAADDRQYRFKPLDLLLGNGQVVGGQDCQVGQLSRHHCAFRALFAGEPGATDRIQPQGFQAVEAGLPQTQVLLWVAGTQLRAGFDHVILAEYHCRYDWRDRRVKDVRPRVFHHTRFASPQVTLLPLTPYDSLVIYRTRARRRAPSRPSTSQLLLFEVVPTA